MHAPSQYCSPLGLSSAAPSELRSTPLTPVYPISPCCTPFLPSLCSVFQRSSRPQLSILERCDLHTRRETRNSWSSRQRRRVRRVLKAV